MQKNEILLPGISNTRELGGYPTENGFIKKGILIRSGSLSKAAPEAVSILKERYRLSHIVDFRMKSKRESEPDPDIFGAENTSLPVMETEDYISGIDEPGLVDRFLAGSINNEDVYRIAFEKGFLGPDMYMGFLLGKRGIKAYRGFFRILLDHDPDRGAILWHCDDGKDRAGIATMLLLTCLGADRDTIIADYLMTNESNAHIIEAARQKYASRGLTGEALNAMIFVAGGVFAEYMDRAIDTLDQKYGSVAGYIREELGLSDHDMKLLRDKYLQALS